MARGHAYRYEASSVEGFIQQLAVSYVTNGYLFYVTGRLRESKDPREVDRKILAVRRRGLEIRPGQEKALGAANVQYLRHGRFFVLLATPGPHRFFEEERAIRDIREVPLKYEGYAVSYRGGHPHVRIEQGTYLNLRAYFEEIATKRSAESIGRQLRSVPFEPYAPVRGQLFNILRRVNAARRAAGLEPVGCDWLRLRRRIVRAFDERELGERLHDERACER